MVDAAASLDARSGTVTRRTAAPASTRHISIHVGLDEALAAYRHVAEHSRFSAAQSPAWVSSWAATGSADVVVAVLELAGAPAFALALETVRSGPFRVARFAGGSHANGNFPPLSTAAPRITRADVDALVAAIRGARPDIDVLWLARNVEEHQGFASPLLQLDRLPSPNVSLAVDLHGGFDALLARSSGKRKRKKHRSQTRKFEAAGGWRKVEATSPAEVSRLLDAFFAMKQERFRKMGIANVFGDARVQAFFRRLFTDALRDARPAFVLHALEVGGKLRAVTASSRTGNRLICEFGAIVEDELAGASPGDFLFFENILAACADGMEIYDFSVGDELYKRLWCDIETAHFDVVVPMSAKGLMFAGFVRAANRATTMVKNSPLAWRLTKALRRQAVAPPAASDD